MNSEEKKKKGPLEGPDPTEWETGLAQLCADADSIPLAEVNAKLDPFLAGGVVRVLEVGRRIINTAKGTFVVASLVAIRIEDDELFLREGFSTPTECLRDKFEGSYSTVHRYVVHARTGLALSQEFPEIRINHCEALLGARPLLEEGETILKIAPEILRAVKESNGTISGPSITTEIARRLKAAGIVRGSGSTDASKAMKGAITMRKTLDTFLVEEGTTPSQASAAEELKAAVQKFLQTV